MTGTMAAAVAGACLIAAPASAGSSGPTVSLGSVGSIEYVKASMGNVLTQAGPAAACDAEDATIGGGGAIDGSSLTSALNATHPSNGSGDAWQAEGRTTGVTGRTVRSFAVCKPDPQGWSSTSLNLDAADGANDFVTKTEDCGPGERMFAGVQGTGGDARIVQTRPTGDQSWASTLQNHGGSSATLTSWYSCSSAYDTALRRRSAVIKPGRSGTVRTPCARREAVLHGGPRATGIDSSDPIRDIWLISSRPVDSKKDRRRVPEDGWRTTIQNSSGASVELGTYARCAPR